MKTKHEPDRSVGRKAQEAGSPLQINPYLHVGCLVNRVPDRETASGAWERFRSAAERFLGHSPDWIGWVPADASVAESIEARSPVVLSHPKSAAAQAITTVARWGPIDYAKGTRPFFDGARNALR